MDINDFQKRSVDTAAISQQGIPALAHRGFGIAGEAGYIANLIKKIIRDKNGVADTADIEAMKKRLGDVMYYTALLAEYYGLSLSEIVEQNIRQSIQFKESRQEGTDTNLTGRP